MTTLISLDIPGHLIDVTQTNFTHILVCDNEMTAKRIQQCSCAPRRVNREENVLKQNILNVATLAKLDEQALKVQILKQLLQTIIQKCKNRDMSLLEGFCYYDFSIKQVQFFCPFQWKPQQLNKANEKTFSAIEMFGIFSFLLFEHSQLKSYVSNWAKLALGKVQLNCHVQVHKRSLVDQFILNVINKQIPTTNIAFHSLSIIEQKLNLQNGSEKKYVLKINKQQTNNSYGNLLISDMKKTFHNSNSSRLKQSNSFSSLNSKSSNKNRKYKKLTQGLIDQTRMRNPIKMTSGSFHQSSGSIQKNKQNYVERSSHYLGNGRNTSENWYRDEDKNDSILQLKSKVKTPFHEDVSTKSQLNLMKILEDKQRTRTVKNVSFWNSSKNVQPQNNQKDETTLRCHLVRPSILAFCSKNIQLKISPVKKQKKLQIVPTVNESLLAKKMMNKMASSKSVKIQQTNFQSERVMETIQNLSNHSIGLNSQFAKQPTPLPSQKSTAPTPFQANKQFINLSINFMGAKKLPVNKFVVLNTLIIFYVVAGKIKYSQQNKKVMKGTISSLVAKIQQMKGKPRLASHNVKDIQYLKAINVLDRTNFENDELESLTQICYRVLKKEFDLSKNQIIKMKKQLIQKKTLKSTLIFMLRLAICISVIGDFERESVGVEDFKRGEDKINSIENQTLVDLRSQISNFECLL